MPRAILIDATNKEVREITIDGSLQSMQKLVGGLIETAMRFPNGDYCFVNEEGLMNGTRNFFSFERDGFVFFAGNGLIVGKDLANGTLADAQTEPALIRKRANFHSVDEVRAFLRGAC